MAAITIKSCAVTGAGGYVGGCIAAALRRREVNVIELNRPAFQLQQPFSPAIFGGADALVHCAYDFAAAGREAIWKANVDGSIRLFEAAKSAGITRTIFISSMSAFTGCRSLYGQAKLAVEAQAPRLGLIIVRPGLVWGNAPRGMIGAMLKVCSLPLLTPLIGRGNQVSYLAHEDDLGDLFCALLGSANAPIARPILAAAEPGMTFRHVLEILSQAAGRRRKIFLPVPPIVVSAGLKTLETTGLRMRMRSDSLVGLLNPDPAPDFSATRQTGVKFRPFSAAAIVNPGHPPRYRPPG